MKRVFIIVLGVLISLILISGGLLKSHLYRMYGGYIELVNPWKFDVQQDLIAITNVSILSPNGNEMLSPKTIIIDDGKIISVSDVNVMPEGATIIDGTNKYLIPGLIDSHVHLRRQPNDLLLYLANGVTHIRHFSGTPNDLELKREIESGRLGPHLYVTSPQLMTSGLLNGWWLEFAAPAVKIVDHDNAEAIVKKMKEIGYDAIKTYDNIDVDTYRVVNKAAQKTGLQLVGHLPRGMVLNDLAVTEQHELAHIEELIKKLQTEFADLGLKDYPNTFANFVASRASEIIGDIIAADMAVNTTLWFSEIVGEQAFNLEALLRALPLEYANPAMLEGSPYTKEFGWLPSRNKFERSSKLSIDEQNTIKAEWNARAEGHMVLFRAMLEAGVTMLAGTDATTHLMVPGFSLHDELASLVRNGMTPAQAIRSATTIPAEYMKSNAGSIQPGKRADLVLLSGNPLIDIANTKSIETVVINGKLLTRKTLDSMLGAVKTANQQSRKFNLETLSI